MAVSITALDYDGSDNLIYRGVAAAGSAKSASVWTIHKYIYSSGNLVDILCSGGTGGLDFVWDDRTSISYS